MPNPFKKLQDMVAAQREVNTGFVELRGLLVKMEAYCHQNSLAPMTQKQMQSLREQGLRLLEDMFLEESRQVIYKSTMDVTPRDIMEYSKEEKTCKPCNGSGKVFDPAKTIMTTCEECGGTGQVRAGS